MGALIGDAGTARVLERFGVQSAFHAIEPKTGPRAYIFVFTLRQCTHLESVTHDDVGSFVEIGRRLGDATARFLTLRDLRGDEPGSRRPSAGARRGGTQYVTGVSLFPRKRGASSGCRPSIFRTGRSNGKT